jgi:transcriptional regulator with XRE-family HTH domain
MLTNRPFLCIKKGQKQTVGQVEGGNPVENFAKMGKLVAIRKLLNLTQEYIANETGFSVSYISKIENAKKPPDDDFINQYKIALGAPDLPLTEDEEAQFKQRLYAWKATVTSVEPEKAKIEQIKLQKCIDLTLSNDLKNLFYIFSVGFYRITNENELLENQMIKLKDLSNTFSDEQLYWYNRQIGVQALLDLQYRTALDSLLLAEQKGSLLNLNNDTIYYSIAHCLTDMGYAFGAIKYVEKSQERANIEKDYTYDVYRRYFLAENYTFLGRYKEALELLNSCLRDENKKTDANLSISLIYRRIAMVYYYMNDYKKALENIDITFTLINAENKSYKDNLYYKAMILIENNKIEQAVICLDEAIQMTEGNPLKNVLYNALKHTTTLFNETSLNYVGNVAIPQLKFYEKNMALIDCYKKLGIHYEKKNLKLSLKYFKSAYELSEKLRKGEYEK